MMESHASPSSPKTNATGNVLTPSELASDNDWVNVSSPPPIDQAFEFVAPLPDSRVKLMEKIAIKENYIPNNGAPPSPRPTEVNQPKIPVYAQTLESSTQTKAPVISFVGMAAPRLNTDSSSSRLPTPSASSPDAIQGSFTARLNKERQENQARQTPATPAAKPNAKCQIKQRTVISKTGNLGNSRT